MSITQQEVDQAQEALRDADVAAREARDVYNRARGLLWMQECGLNLGDIVTEKRRGERRMVIIGVQSGFAAVCRWVLRVPAAPLGADNHICYDPVVVGHYDGELPAPVWR